MLKPACPACKNTSFEMQEMDIRHANFRYFAITCASCGVIVHVNELYNVNSRLNKLARKLKVDLDVD